jgi:hypothetical protein
MARGERAIASFFDPRLPDRFWSKCIPEPNSGCWIWFGATTDVGYGKMYFGDRDEYAHRITLRTLLDMDIPTRINGERIVVDHLCRLRCCCNPTHLEIVTHGDNIRRGANGAERSRCHARIEKERQRRAHA